MYYTYVLRSTKDRKLYTGFTNDLRKRFKEHNEGKSRYTKSRGPFELIYYEACHNRDDARSRELYLKSGMGKRYIKARLKRFLFQVDESRMKPRSLKTYVMGLVLLLDKFTKIASLDRDLLHTG